jgi:hypothetical protein
MYCYHKDNDNINIFVLKYLLNRINYMVIILIVLFSYFLLIFNIFVCLSLHEVINSFYLLQYNFLLYSKVAIMLVFHL